MWHTAALIGALLALGSWIALCLVAQPLRIEEGLRLETERVLAEADLVDVRITVSGRGAALEGLVASPAVLAEAERLVAGVAGIRGVDNRLTLRDEASEPVPTYLEISVRPGGLSLRGAVPTEELRLEVVEQARRHFGVDRVEEELTVDATVQEGAALAAAAGVVSALAEAGDGVRARLKGDSLRLSGTVATLEARRLIEQRARAAAPGVRLFFSALTVSSGGAGDAPAERPVGEERGS